ncbi:hypothetical protein HUK80_00620 [Flavobacterium sp. MAH-1]|uniref:Uncharacterized protein n=1 Tax=Flavobacterium agri TaxID=2743471 RepID=A0A7Y9C404_9FLAO|nr:hypothetical protein [Flavobacterium agri]NUY79381.1 hypothetical protein [Flavobacterium agri]NYA69405.1 hypothetical protein [Flavobacterium agri]
MIEPLIGFTIFSVFVFLLLKLPNKTRAAQYKTLIDKIKPQTKRYIEQTKSSTSTWGLNNPEFLFNRCDIYLTQTAIVILGFTKDSFFKQLSLPIILTKDISAYAAEYPYCHVTQVNKMDFGNNVVTIDFGEKGILQTEVKIRLAHLDETAIGMMKLIVEKKNW